MFDFFRRRRIKKYTEKALTYVCENFELPANPIEAVPDQSSTIQYSLKRSLQTKVDDKVKTDENIGESRYSFAEEQPDDIKYSLRDDNVRYSLKEESDEKIRYSRREQPESGTEDDKNKASTSGVMYCLEKESDDKYNPSAVSNVLRNYSTSANSIETLRTLEKNVNQTFADRLLFYINKKGVRDSEVYKAAQVDKRLFSKIVSNREYKPAKDTAIAFALALELSLDDANDLLSRAGYAFSHSNKRDIIIEFFFREKIYNLIDANEVLYSLNQKIIGRN